jgi:D-serine deaminase-like pyridoxal phosphate-dependent protein
MTGLDHGTVAGSSLHQAYRPQIGRSLADVPTPALVVDRPTLLANLATMRDRMAGLSAALRPHIKVHKCPQLALLQIEHGAIGVACATAWEAVVMAEAGISDVLVANQVVGQEKLAAICRAARSARLTVAVDDARNVRDLDAAAAAAGVRLEVLIERDIGMQRGGVRDDRTGVEIARVVAGHANLTLRGVQGYEGHCMLEPDRDVRVAEARSAIETVLGFADALIADGHAVDVVSGGGTGTYDITGANPRVTELQAGSYALMDLFHGNLVPGFERALSVHATVSVRHGDTVVLDAGRKSVGIDFVQPRMRGYEIEARYFAEEHGIFDFPSGTCPFDLGDRVDLIPGYAPTTANLYDVMHVVEGGVVVDIWPIVPRGPGAGLAHLGPVSAASAR